MNLKVLEATV